VGQGYPIIVTGGAGYIGSHICVALIEAGFAPVIVDDLSNAHRDVVPRIKKITGVAELPFYEMDVRDSTGLESIFSDHQAAAVIHLAAKKSVEESVTDPLAYYSANIGGLISLLQVMKKVGVKNLVYSSSATVYAPSSEGVYTEGAPLGPVNPYGATKYMGERIIGDVVATGDIVAGILRYFNPVGAHESGLIGELPKGKPNNLMPIVAQVVSGTLDRVTVFGNDYPTHDGTAVRDFVHVMDVAEAHVVALRKILAEQSGFTLNIGTGRGLSVLDIISTYARENDVNIPYVFGPRRAGDVAHVCADVAQAREFLGWEAVRDVAEMCRDLHRWITKPGTM